LRSGELDFVIVVDPGEHPDLDLEPLVAGELLYACLPAGHRLTKRQTVRPADVRDETLICSGKSINPAVTERTLAGFAAAGDRFGSVEEASGPTARDMAFAVASGRGVALLPASLDELSEADDDVILRPLDPPLRLPPSAVAWRTNAEPGLRPIMEAVRSVARSIFEAVDGDARSRSGAEGVAHGRLSTDLLTPRQLEVLNLLAEGKSTREIADELWLSQTTVRNHIAGLMAALGVHTRRQAVIAAERGGLLAL
jgi:DNA-binding CsgD family transcriptional regulator